MPPDLNPAVTAVAPPPIPEARAWIADRESNRELLDVAQAVPSHPPPASMRAHLAERVQESDAGLYTGILGLEDLRDAIAVSTREDYRGDIDASHVVVTPGCNQAMCTVLMALAGAGDEVVMPLPYYFNHDMWARMLGVVVRYLPYAEHLGGEPDLDRLESLVGPRTRAIVLVSPNNPTGAEYAPATIDTCHEIARRHGTVLVVDETYKDFRATSEPAHCVLARSDWEGSFVQLYSFSKSYALTGYRVGSIVCGTGLRAEIEKLQDCLAICPSRIGQYAALFGLRHLGHWRARKCAETRRRAQALREGFAAGGLDYRLLSSGAYFAWVRHPFEREAHDVARRLARSQGVLGLPGTFFGPGLEPYLRLAFANLQTDRIPELIARLRASQDDA